MNEIYHHGIKGQRWGVRRFQNEDGTRTAAGRRHEMALENKNVKSSIRAYNKAVRRNSFLAGHSTQDKLKNLSENLNDSIVKRADKRAELAREQALAKGKDADKAERKAYAKDMHFTGLSGSIKNAQTNGAGDKLYDSIAAKKGEAFAKSVEKQVMKEAFASIAVSAAVSVGASFVSAYLGSR